MENDLCYCDGREISNINYLIFMFSVVPFTCLTSFLISSAFVEKYIWRPYVIKSLLETDDVEEEESPPEIYTEKYLFDDNEDEDYVEGDDYEKFNIIETTPNGNIIMNYNKKDEVWHYWIDKKNKNNITFDELDTVCRKYCLTYNCKPLYIDKKRDIEEQKQEIKRKEEEEKMKKEDKQLEKEVNSDDELFVKAKISTNNKRNKKNVICARKSNRYKYMGDLNEFPAFNIKREVKNEKKDLGWLAWKSASR